MKTAIVGFLWDDNIVQWLQELMAAAQSAGETPPSCDLWLFGTETIEDSQITSLPCAKIYLSGALLDNASPAEAILPVLEEFYALSAPNLLLFPGTLLGEELAERFAYRKEAQIATSVRALERQGGSLLVTRGVYAQNLMAAYSFATDRLFLCVSKGSFASLEKTENTKPEIEYIEIENGPDATYGRDILLEPSQEQGQLENAKRLVVAGRGVGSKAGVEKIAAFAQKIHAEWGVTRPVSTDGWASHDRVIGLSGAVTKPDFCLLLGVSGSAAFLYGVRAGKTIIAVNTDPTALIFKSCDAGAVADYQPVLDELGKLLSE